MTLKCVDIDSRPGGDLRRQHNKLPSG